MTRVYLGTPGTGSQVPNDVETPILRVALQLLLGCAVPSFSASNVWQCISDAYNDTQ